MNDDKLNEGRTKKKKKSVPEGSAGNNVVNTAGEVVGAAAKHSLKSIIINVLTVAGIVTVFTVGLVVMFYPNISNYVNLKNQSRVLQSYQEAVNTADPVDYEKYIEAAMQYNAKLAGQNVEVSDAFMSGKKDANKEDEYWDLLKIGESNIMGYVNVDSLGIEVPLYHGTGDVVLSVGAGHIQGSSLPVGGESTHTAVSAHTGLPSAKFFDKIDTLKEGDTFSFHVMNKVLTYEVDQILVVLPEEVDALSIVSGEDYATLITCTPYGINTHRLLVRGTRVETPPEKMPENIIANKEEEEEISFLKSAENFVVEKLSVMVEYVATKVVNIARRVMDVFGVEY